jgi:hypothetical protein
METTVSHTPADRFANSLEELRAAMAAEGTRKGLAGAIHAAILGFLNMLIALLADLRAGRLAALAPGATCAASPARAASPAGAASPARAASPSSSVSAPVAAVEDAALAGPGRGAEDTGPCGHPSPSRSVDPSISHGRGAADAAPDAEDGAIGTDIGGRLLSRNHSSPSRFAGPVQPDRLLTEQTGYMVDT